MTYPGHDITGEGSAWAPVLTRPANDVCRCLDDACPSREICARWVYRNDGGPNTPVTESLRGLPGCEQYDYCGGKEDG